MQYNKNFEYRFFQHVDSECNLSLILQSPYKAPIFWQFCYSTEVLPNTFTGEIHSEIHDNLLDGLDLHTLMKPKNQLHSTSSFSVSSVSMNNSYEKTQNQNQQEPVDSERFILKKPSNESSISLFHSPSKFEIYLEEFPLEHDEIHTKTLRNYLFSV